MRVRLSDVETRVEELLSSMQPEQPAMSASAYDTAWIALLSKRFRGHGFEQALDWIRSHQHNDGSWGSLALHYHDRILNTLMSLIALRHAGDERDHEQIARGEAFIEWHYRSIKKDTYRTAGFSLLIHKITAFARKAGLNLPPDMYPRSKKLDSQCQLLLFQPQTLLHSPAVNALEAFLPEICDIQPDFNPVAPDGSVMGSPAATAASLFTAETPDRRSLHYLQRLLIRNSEGGVPVASMELSNIAFTLDVLLDAGVVSINHPQVTRLIDGLAQHWDSESGIACSRSAYQPDFDTTVITFRLLRASGYDVSADVFQYYEGADYFKGYPGESSPSISSNVSLLASLPFARNHLLTLRWQQKIKQMLQHENTKRPQQWIDRAHTSPYYPLYKATCVLTDTMPEILEERIDWLLETQHSNGGWGYQGTTQEETAYAMLTLLYQDASGRGVDPGVLDAGANYLYDRFQQTEYDALWLAKVLYAPGDRIHAATLAALYRYEHYREAVKNAG